MYSSLVPLVLSVTSSTVVGQLAVNIRTTCSTKTFRCTPPHPSVQASGVSTLQPGNCWIHTPSSLVSWLCLALLSIHTHKTHSFSLWTSMTGPYCEHVCCAHEEVISACQCIRIVNMSVGCQSMYLWNYATVSLVTCWIVFIFQIELHSITFPIHLKNTCRCRK